MQKSEAKTTICFAKYSRKQGGEQGRDTTGREKTCRQKRIISSRPHAKSKEIGGERDGTMDKRMEEEGEKGEGEEEGEKKGEEEEEGTRYSARPRAAGSALAKTRRSMRRR